MKKDFKFFEKKYIGTEKYEEQKIFAVPCGDGFLYAFIEMEPSVFVLVGTEPRKTESEIIQDLKAIYVNRNFISA